MGQSPNQQKLEQISWIVGTWDHRGTLADGQSLWVTREYKWALDRHYITCVNMLRVGGQPQLVHRHMIGWDAKAKIYRSWIFSSDGNFVRGAWPHREGDRREGKLGGLTPEGDQILADAAYQSTADDKFVFEVRNYTVGGQAQPDITWEFTRRSADAQAP
jgi:hypothetical protein